jgi:XTP/dITP diphosphohydrolase
MKLRFLSSNRFKISEVKAILTPIGIEVVPVASKIEELQTTDMDALVRDKCIKAFRQIGRPLFVEHTGLHIDALGGFPGGLTQIFWDTLQADRFSKLFGNGPDNSLIARTIVGYCDGKRITQFSGEIRGTVSDTPRGNRDFQWDCVFVPKGGTETFAEMGDKKNEISMRKLALDSFAKYLEEV